MTVPLLTRLSVFPLLFLILAAVPSFAQAPQGYYVEEDGRLSHTPAGDPAKVQAKEWHIRLYKKGQSTGGRNNWGLIIGDSAASVLRQLKRAQEIELSSNAFFGRGRVPDPVDTHFNPLGPIAIVRTPPDRLQKLADAALKLKDRKEQLDEIAEQAALILKNEPAAKNPFKEVGSVFREYVDNLLDAQKKLAALQQKVALKDLPLAQITAGLSAVEAELGQAQRSRDVLQGIVDRSASPSTAGGWTYSSVIYSTKSGIKVFDSDGPTYEDPERNYLLQTTLDVGRDQITMRYRQTVDGQSSSLTAYIPLDAASEDISVSSEIVSFHRSGAERIWYVNLNPRPGQQFRGGYYKDTDAVKDGVRIPYDREYKARAAQEGLRALVSPAARLAKELRAPLNRPLVTPVKRAEEMAARANERWSKRDLAGAAADYRKALLFNPQDLTAVTGMGLVASDRKDYAGAEKWFLKAKALAPENFIPLSNLAYVYSLQRKNLAAGAEYARRSIRLQPGYPNSHANLAACLFFLGKKAEAKREALTALELGDPGTDEVFRLLNLKALTRSLGSSTPTEIHIVNRRAKYVTVFWVDGAGGETRMVSLSPTSEWRSKAHTLSLWRVRDMDTGTLLQEIGLYTGNTLTVTVQ